MSTSADITSVWRLRTQERRRLRRERANADARRDHKSRYLLAHIGERMYAFPLTNVVAVVPLPPDVSPIRLPDAPPGFWGLLALRGEVRPVFEGAFLFQEESPEDIRDGRHVLLLRPTDAVASPGDNIVGLRVDRAAEVSVFSSEETVSSVADDKTTVSGWTRGGINLSVTAGEAEERPPVALLIAVEALLAHLRGGDPSGADTEDSEPPQDREEGREEKRT